MKQSFVTILLLVVASIGAIGQKLENAFDMNSQYRLNSWWSLHGGVAANFGYGDVNWQSGAVDAAIRFRANGWISFQLGGMMAYAHYLKAYREQEYRTHEAIYISSPDAHRVKFYHQFRLEQRNIKYKNIDVDTYSSRIIYRVEPRIIVSGENGILDKDEWFIDVVAAVNFNMKSELAVNDFFQRALTGCGVGYAISDDLNVRMLYSMQFGKTQPYYYGEEDGLNTLRLTLTHRLHRK